MAMTNDDPGRSGLGWQGDGVDVEIESIWTDAGAGYLWVLYDRACEVKSGVSRTAHRAAWRSAFEAWRYRSFNRRS